MKKILLILMAVFAFGLQNVCAQDGIKIVTNHPDFKVKVKRCAASDKTVIINLILNNTGFNDVEGLIAWGGSGSEAYDDEGNIYRGNNLQVSIANTQKWNSWNSDRFDIPSGVPMKLSVRLEGVPQSVESIAQLKLDIYCRAWSIGSDNKKLVKINNIPITRD